MNRRTFLRRCAHTIGIVATGIIAVPAALNALAPLFVRRPAHRWRTLGALEAFPIDEVSPANVALAPTDAATRLREKGVYVWRRRDRETVVFSRNCTDLSCPVTHDPGSRWFYCPCHGGIFNAEGEPVAGPPNRPLYRYATRVREGQLEIDLDSLPPMT